MGLMEKIAAFGDIPEKRYSLLVENAEVLYLEHCLRVSGCGENLIELGVSDSAVKITGLNLTLENFGSDGIKITGKIHSVTWEAL